MSILEVTEDMDLESSQQLQLLYELRKWIADEQESLETPAAASVEQFADKLLETIDENIDTVANDITDRLSVYPENVTTLPSQTD